GPRAKEPIRAYAGLESAATDEQRSPRGVDALDRTRAWQRAPVVVAGTAGAGWINRNAAQAGEPMGPRGAAIGGPQAPSRPSWIACLADREKAEAAGKALIDAVVAWRDSLPPELPRPDLYVYGESLSTQAGEAAFSGIRD